MHCKLKASLTVEASLLLPPILLVLLLVLYLFAHVHSRAVLTAYACEQAVSGKEQEVQVLFFASDVSKDTAEIKKERKVSYSFRTAPLLWPADYPETETASYTIIDPAAFAHRAAALRGLVKKE